MRMATQFVSGFGMVFAVSVFLGCSTSDGEQKPPDYDALRTELEDSISAVPGWSALDLEHTPDELTGIRTSRVTELIWRSFRSDETGEEVRMTLVGGHRRHVFRNTPGLGSGCEVRRLPKSLFAAASAGQSRAEQPNRRRYVEYGEAHMVWLESAAGSAYAFMTLEQIRPDRRQLLWSRTLDGKWTASLRAILGASPQNTYGFMVVFEVVSPPHFELDEPSADAKRLIANLMDRINPIVFASQPPPTEPPLLD
jgi:hypothetical protein